MASADVATAKASATLINNLIIVSSHVIQDAIESEGWNLSRSYRETIRQRQIDLANKVTDLKKVQGGEQP
ncbi:MAG: hypothetical protein WAM06_02945 [Methyloceanibacter sp.]